MSSCMMSRWVVCAGWALWLPVLPAAEMVALRPVADTTLIEAAPDNNLGGQLFFNAGTTMAGNHNRAVVRFDLSPHLPPGSVILSATLEVAVVGTPPSGQAQSSLFGWHRLLQPWGEGIQLPENPFSPGLGAPAAVGEATWNDRGAGLAAPWAEPGGRAGVDYVGTPSTTEQIEGEGTYIFDGAPRLLSDLQAWVDGPDANYGWMLRTFSEDLAYTARRFGSREDEMRAPVLRITFEPIPEPGLWGIVWLLVGLGCFARGLNPARRRRHPPPAR